MFSFIASFAKLYVLKNFLYIFSQKCAYAWSKYVYEIWFIYEGFERRLYDFILGSFYIKSFLSPKGAQLFVERFLLDYQIHSYIFKNNPWWFLFEDLTFKKWTYERERERTKDVKYGNLALLERIKKRFRETFEKFKRVSLIKHVSLSLSTNNL